MRLLRELGRGGMGVVYQARQLKLNRVVALKMILDDCRDRPQEYARFLSEAEVIAGLNHPNIVQIYEIGEAEGRPFFSLEFVEGGNLAQRLRGSDPLPPRPAGRLIADLARGVDAAHRQGVVHRDLKPANVLLAGLPAAPIEECTPKITDFGLAKRRGEGVKTTAGFILGTPCYMAPEQAAGKPEEVGPASDVYSLGAILYELLTGQPPFQDDAPLVTLQRVLSEDPVAPSQLKRRPQDDLDIICLKCLQKQPARRYSGAAALADDLERFLDGRPIQARPTAAAERLVKWTRRRPATAVFVGVSLLALLLLLAGAAWHTLQLHDALAAADRARIDAQTERDALRRAKALVEDRERLVREYVYAVQLRQAQQLWYHADLTPMRELLAPYATPGDSDPREFTWRYLWRLSHSDRRTLEGHTSDVYFVAWSPDGRRLVSAGREGVLHLWDAATGRDLYTLSGHKQEVNSAAFSPDGAALASVGDDGRIILWDAATGQERRRLQDSGEALQTVAWSPGGRLIAAAGRDRRIHLWDVDSGRQLAPLDGHSDQVESVAFNDDGRALASGGRDGGVLIWDVDRMALSQKLDTGRYAVETVAWSRDGRRLAAACGDGRVRLWNADSWTPRPPLNAHLGEAQGVAFSPDGKTLATCGNDHLVGLYDVEKSEPRLLLRGHGDRVWSVAFSPDGRTLASAGRDRVVKLWDPERRQDSEVIPTESVRVRAMVVSPRGDVVALGGGGRKRSPAADPRRRTAGRAAAARRIADRRARLFRRRTPPRDAERRRDRGRLGHEGAPASTSARQDGPDVRVRFPFRRRRRPGVPGRGRIGAALGRGHGKDAALAGGGREALYVPGVFADRKPARRRSERGRGISGDPGGLPHRKGTTAVVGPPGACPLLDVFRRRQDVGDRKRRPDGEAVGRAHRTGKNRRPARTHRRRPGDRLYAGRPDDRHGRRRSAGVAVGRGDRPGAGPPSGPFGPRVRARLHTGRRLSPHGVQQSGGR